MSLAARIASTQPNKANDGCQSCHWWATVPTDTRTLINNWIDGGYSQMQLWEILTAPDPDSNEVPLAVSLSGWRFHLKHHAERCR